MVKNTNKPTSKIYDCAAEEQKRSKNVRQITFFIKFFAFSGTTAGGWTKGDRLEAWME